MAKSTSWETVKPWYNKIVGNQGHYYHQHVILPKTLQILNLNESSSVLDLACGQGILARHLPEKVPYTGVDIAPSLITAAKKETQRHKCTFLVSDATKPLAVPKTHFSHCVCLLALQNVEKPEKLIQNAAIHLQEKGTFFFVINHPCFRIPRQSSWGIDAQKKLQYRRVDRYLSPLEIPILAHPGDPKSSQTLSFHFPLSQLTQMLAAAGFAIVAIEEWCSNKTSTGKAAKMENLCRKEFPLFMAVKAIKCL